MNSFTILSVVVVACIVLQVNGQDEFYGKQEPNCLKEGGLCIKSSECDQFLGAKGELCPQQAVQGFQCCLGLPKNDKRCQRHGGECFKKNFCSENVLYKDASDCGDEQECCILL